MVGEYPVPFSELEAWQSTTGVGLDEFEATSIRTLSQHYASMLREAAAVGCPAPVMKREALPTRENISQSLGDLLRSFNSPQAKAGTAKRQAARRDKATE